MTHFTPPDSLQHLSDYIFTEAIYQGTRTTVYRAVETATQKPVVIKVSSCQYPSYSELVHFRNQYTVTKNLSIAGIVRPLSLEPYGNGYALVMEDSGSNDLGQYVKQFSLSLAETLGIAIQLADILHELHQHRVIHKDIKPANILIHPDSQQVKLIDFSIASLLPKEVQTIQSPGNLEGTLAYLAPEQTGRMNRAIDYRTDFYALGVTLYQLLTEQLPFTHDDSMELIHCHIAQLPMAVNQVNAEVPLPVAAIVAKLMAKTAEERYQSALGLKHDLERCLTQWQENREIADFELGQRDVSDRFLIPEKLYGRESEVQTLLDAFERITYGTSELILVAGFSGIGKTAVVNEVHKPIVRQRGYFIKGKFDQFNRNVPFSAFVQAFQDLMQQLLSESDAELQAWKGKILGALGDNTQVIIDLIPELEYMLGPQPPAPALSGTAVQNRFNLLFQKFIQVFTTAEHPLVMFVDDLQWADSASLNLIQVLMGEAQTGHLLMLGAYRDNEVFPAHPMMLTLEDLGKSDVNIETITLQPLPFNSLNHLIADTLHSQPSVVKPLTELVMQKTQGNPFFATQFLKALHQDRLIAFDHDAGHWQCDITQVHDAALTNNVVEFMAFRLQKLPAATREMLKLAACIGASFDLEALTLVSEKSQTGVSATLWQAVQEGAILPQSKLCKFYLEECEGDENSSQEEQSYRFLHDRVQQAAYSLIPANQKQQIHLSIGQRLLQQTSISEPTSLFTIVNHLNLAQDLICDLEDRWQLVRLNLQAGQAARQSTAYQAAFDYLTTGLGLLPPQAWQQQYDLVLSLYQEGAIAASLVGDFGILSEWTTIALEQARTLLDQVSLHETQIQARVAQKQLPEALQLGIATLEKLGVTFSEHPQPDAFPQGIAAIADQIGDREIAELLSLTPMQDPQNLAILRILWRLSSVLMMSAPQLMPFCMFKAVELSITAGNSALSAPAYTTYGMILCGAVGDVPTGYQFGQLGLQIVEKYHGEALRAKTLARFNAGVRHWQEPLQNTLGSLAQGYQIALEVGDFESAAICAEVFGYHAYFAGQELTQLAKDLQVYSQGIETLQQQTMLYWNESYRQHVLNLLGQSDNPCRLIGEAYDETVTLPKQQAYQDGFGLAMVHLLKAIAYYLFEEYEQAIELLNTTAQFFPSFAPFAAAPVFHFYTCLTHLAMTPSATDGAKVEIPDPVEQSHTRLQQCAVHAPMNYQHKVDLIAAEKYRVAHRRYEAAEAYDLAIAGAKANDYIQDEALANELAAKFYLAWGKAKVAAGYMQDAYYGYARWGAQTKIADLEHRYPELLRPILQSAAASEDMLNTLGTIASPPRSSHVSTRNSSSRSNLNQILDFASVLKASQTLSGTIQLDELLRQLTQIILQNSGSDRCALILPNEQGEWQVRAVATPAEIKLCTEPLDDRQNLPIKLIQYVKNTHEIVVINNLKTDLPVLDDYFRRQQPESVLCLVIFNQRRCIGVIFLENHLVSGVFTNERITVLNFLCTQAGISLENSRLYESVALKSSVIESSTDSMAILDGDQFVYLNESHEALFGYELPELMGQSWEKLYPAAEVQRFKEQVFVRLAQTGQWSGEATALRKDGSTFAEEVSLSSLGDGKLICICRDISDRKRAEAVVLQKSHDLEKALVDLQNAQLQMVQSEKMSALGGLVAGVAHEINNPVGCILGNVKITQNYINDLLGLIDLYAEQLPESGADIDAELDDIDLEFVREDLPQLIRAMKDSGDRIKAISKSLRTFSRADTDHKQLFNLHDGMDSTVLILRHRLKANEQRPTIEVVTDYGDIPEINCFPGQLNQVFMNILANAIDALDDASQHRSFAELKAHPHRITIRTALDNGQVTIAIADNGPGIPEEIKANIFNHLFTTKAVGKGTGLGLAIARQIVEDTHGGRLEIHSTVGQGAEFCIRLPL